MSTAIHKLRLLVVGILATSVLCCMSFPVRAQAPIPTPTPTANATLSPTSNPTASPTATRTRTPTATVSLPNAPSSTPTAPRILGRAVYLPLMLR